MSAEQKTDGFYDAHLAQTGCVAIVCEDGITNGVCLLVRPHAGVRDESGEHPGETFVEVTLTRQEVRAIADWLDEDWRYQVSATPHVLEKPYRKDKTPAQKRAETPLVSHARNVASKRLKFHAGRIAAAPIAAANVVPAIAIAAFVVTCKVCEAALSGLAETQRASLGRWKQ